MIHKDQTCWVYRYLDGDRYKRECCAQDLFCASGGVCECGNCGARDDD